MFEKIKKEISLWSKDKFLAISIFNTVIIILFMLRSAGYFHPYFLISVNFIVEVGLVMSIILLGARSRVIFIVSLLFWVFAAFLRAFDLDVWAERTAIYTYQALVLGVILLIIEEISTKSKKI